MIDLNHDSRHDNPKLKQFAAAILQRHALNEAEASITGAIRALFIETQLAKSDEIV